jgi:hypothetical protein
LLWYSENSFTVAGRITPEIYECSLCIDGVDH